MSLSKAEIDRLQALVDEISALRDALVKEGLIIRVGVKAVPNSKIDILADKTETMIEAFTLAEAKLTGRSDLATIRAAVRRSLFPVSAR